MAILNTPEEIRAALGISEAQHTVRSYLRDQLKDKGLEGDVAAIFVKGGNKIHYYPVTHTIKPDVASNQLNWSIGMRGSRLMGTISEKSLDKIQSYKDGYFVPGSSFGQPGTYVALVGFIDNVVGIEIPEDAIKFP